MTEALATTEAVTPTPVTVVEETKPTIEDTMAAVFDKNYPDSRVTRDNTSGEFKSKNPAPIKAEGAEVSDPAETVTDQTPDAKAEETAPPSIPRPQSWSSDRDEMWAKLSPDVQELIAKREGEAHKQITEFGTKAKAAEKFSAVLEKYRPIINSAPEQEIENLLYTKAEFLRDPVGSIQRLAQQAGVDLARLSPQIGVDNSEHPQVNALNQRIQHLERQLAQTSQRIQEREQAEDSARVQTLTESVEKFSSDPTRKDHWDAIEPEVHRQVKVLIEENPARSKAEPLAVLKEAYDRAVILTPAVKEKLEKAAKVEADKKAEVERNKKAAEAKRLSSINTKSSSGAAPKSNHKDMYSEMADIYDKITSG